MFTSSSFQHPSPYEPFPSPEEAHLWGLRQVPVIAERLDWELRAMQNYKGPFHKVINAHLRNDRRVLREVGRSSRLRTYRNQAMEADIEILMDLMADASIDRPAVAWRGFNGEEQAAALLVNVRRLPFVDAGFVSTTLDPAYAEGYNLLGGHRHAEREPDRSLRCLPHGNGGHSFRDLRGGRGHPCCQ